MHPPGKPGVRGERREPGAVYGRLEGGGRVMASPAARATAPVSARLVPLAVLLLAAHPARGGTGLLRDVVFTDYTPLSSNLEPARRLLTPFAAATLPERVAGSGQRLSEPPIELSEERFIVY